MTRDDLLTQLFQLLPPQFEVVVLRANIPPQYLSATTAPQATRAVEVFRYMELQNRLGELARTVRQVATGHGPIATGLKALHGQRARTRKVFVSSTCRDLVPIREHVRAALQRIDYADMIMEHRLLADSRPANICIDLVRDADLYLGIFAWHYGSISEGYDISITELEYLTARQNNKICIVLMLADAAPWPVRFIDSDRQRIEDLRSRLIADNPVTYFRDSSDMISQLYSAIEWHDAPSGGVDILSNLQQEFEQACSLLYEKQRDIHTSFRLFDFQRDIRISEIYVQEILDTKVNQGPYAQLEPRLRRTKPERIKDSKLLQQIRQEPLIRLYSIEGRAGAGKSTMLRMWLLNLLESWAEDKDSPFPIYVALREVMIPDPASEMTWLQSAMSRSVPNMDTRFTTALFDSVALTNSTQKQEFLLLADGLDEMPSGSRKHILSLLASLPRHFRIVLTCRPGILTETGYLVGSRSYELCDFETGQIEEYITKWFSSRPQIAAGFMEKIQGNIQLRSLASIPLLLACLAIHVELEGGINFTPEIMEHDLLRTSVEILLERWDAWKEGRPVDADFVLGCMKIFGALTRYPRDKIIAWSELIDAVPVLASNKEWATDIMNRIAKNGRILIGNPLDGYRFSHGIFYDFFFASRLEES